MVLLCKANSDQPPTVGRSESVQSGIEQRASEKNEAARSPAKQSTETNKTPKQKQQPGKSASLYQVETPPSHGGALFSSHAIQESLVKQLRVQDTLLWSHTKPQTHPRAEQTMQSLFDVQQHATARKFKMRPLGLMHNFLSPRAHRWAPVKRKLGRANSCVFKIWRFCRKPQRRKLITWADKPPCKGYLMYRLNKCPIKMATRNCSQFTISPSGLMQTHRCSVSSDFLFKFMFRPQLRAWHRLRSVQVSRKDSQNEQQLKLTQAIGMLLAKMSGMHSATLLSLKPLAKRIPAVEALLADALRGTPRPFYGVQNQIFVEFSLHSPRALQRWKPALNAHVAAKPVTARCLLPLLGVVSWHTARKLCILP